MRVKPIVFALIALANAPVMAGSNCTSTFSLGTLSPSSIALFGNQFWRAQSFNDCFSFKLNSPSDALGLTLEWDWSSRLNIDLKSVTLSGGNLVSDVVDLTPDVFTFNGLLSGNYVLALSGKVTRAGPGLVDFGVGYQGVLVTSAPRIASPVPEPETLAMLALGFGVVAWSNRRKS